MKEVSEIKQEKSSYGRNPLFFREYNSIKSDLFDEVILQFQEQAEFLKQYIEQNAELSPEQNDSARVTSLWGKAKKALSRQKISQPK